MKSGSQNKKKSQRSLKKQGYYKSQFLRTSQNKLRRKQRRQRRAQFWSELKNQPTTGTTGTSQTWVLEEKAA